MDSPVLSFCRIKRQNVILEPVISEASCQVARRSEFLR